MEYDLIRLFEHEHVCLFELIPAAIVTLSTDDTSPCLIRVEWARSAGEAFTEAELTLRWDLDALRAAGLPRIDQQLRSRRQRDDDQAKQTEETAVAVAVAVMSLIEPATRFTDRSAIGSRHDYYLNDTADEMIEVAGRWGDRDSVVGLFDRKRTQSDKNTNLRKRWVSVTTMHPNPRNRTGGLHT